VSNLENLKGHGFDERTAEEQRKIASMGGKASAKARREKKNLRIALEMLLEKDFKDKSGKTVSGTEAITAKLFEQAMRGNIKAFETIRSTVGQDPVQKVMVADVDPEVINEVESIVLGNSDDDKNTGD